MEVLLGMGQIESVVTVVVNGVEIPQGQSGQNMTATGWFNLVTPGTRNGAFNWTLWTRPGSRWAIHMAAWRSSVWWCRIRVSSAQSLPTIDVLLMGLMLERFDSGGNS